MENPQYLSATNADTIRLAARSLYEGNLVAFPTETVYGLGADARNPDAVRRIYEVKGRPTDHPLIVHISSINQLEKWACEIPDYAISLARAFWPGPMTLILKRTRLAGDFITGGQGTVGLRVPSDPIALALIQEFEKISNSAIAAPSANRFGQVSPTSSSDVYEELGEYFSDLDVIIDGGKSLIGLESTIIDCTSTEPVILRSGYVTREEIELYLGIKKIRSLPETKVKFSGSFDKHYAPSCKIILGDLSIKGAGFLAMIEKTTPPDMLRLESPRTIGEFARALYATFRKADRQGLDYLVVHFQEKDGLADAINERLKKAAGGR